MELPSLSLGLTITATATSASNDTSEFAQAVAVTNSFVVTNTHDMGLGSLYEAIQNVNANLPASGATDTITFAIPTSDPGYRAGTFTIALSTALSAIMVPVTIDGTSQPGYFTQPPNPPGSSPPTLAPLIELNGSAVAGDGLTLAAGSDGSTIQGLDIVGFASGAGIHVESNDDTLAADWIGLTPAGSASANAEGVLIDGSASGNTTTGSTIGLFRVAPTNSAYPALTANGLVVISGNSGDGIDIDSSSSNTAIENTYVGTDVTGTIAIPNGGDGIDINDSTGNNIGEPFGPINLISGNNSIGVLIESSSSGNMVQNSYVGTDVSGEYALGNRGDGIVIMGSSMNSLGGTIAGSPLLVSGNLVNGITISSEPATATSSSTVAVPSSDNVIENAYVGTDLHGRSEIPNGDDGIEIDDSTDNSIGEPFGPINLISGNNSIGVLIEASSSGNTVQNSYVGTNLYGEDPAFYGESPIGNGGDGIVIMGSSQNTLGGTIAGEPLVVSGNSGNGITICSEPATATSPGSVTVPSSDNVIENAYVGTDVYGFYLIGNGDNGIAICNSTGNSVGGTISGLVNVISGNNLSGVLIENGASQNVVQNSFIGTDAYGSYESIPNGDGIQIDGSSQNTLGGTIAGSPLLVSGNSGNGIVISGDPEPTGSPPNAIASDNLIENTYVGTDISGSFAIANGGDGIDISDSTGNSVGGTSGVITTGNVVFDLINLISGNGSSGVVIQDGASRTWSRTRISAATPRASTQSPTRAALRSSIRRAIPLAPRAPVRRPTRFPVTT